MRSGSGISDFARVVEEYPDTRAADEAREMIEGR